MVVANIVLMLAPRTLFLHFMYETVQLKMCQKLPAQQCALRLVRLCPCIHEMRVKVP